jgi:hypothetical protein
LIVVLAVALVLPACGSGDPELDTIDAFFSSIQEGDQVAIARVSIVEFDGTPESWEILERGAESEAPFHLVDLEAELEEKRREVRDKRSENSNFVSDNRETYDAYIAAYNENPSAPFQGELATFHEQIQENQRQLAQSEVDAEQLALDVEALKNVATLSLGTPVDENFEGQIKMKPLQVRVNEDTYTMTLHRYDLVDSRLGRAPTPRWIVAEIQPSG